jgi:alkylation response protein AidB-like acyl-CoA dehydrogenase
MDFEDTPEEAAFRKKVRAWLDANAEPKASTATKALDSQSGHSIAAAQAWQAKKADAGWACLTWPKEYGGRGLSSIHNVIWSQEERKYDTPINVFGIGIGMLGPTIMAHGTDTQKERYLNPMLRGEEIWSQLFSEPDAGSDLAGLRTTAVRDGDQWIINGQKIWTTGAHYSKWGMVLTRTDPTTTKHRGITYFIVDLESPGIDIRPIKQISGGSGFNEVFFDDVVVPNENIVGEVDGGWRGAITTLMNERSSIGGGGGIGPSFDDLVTLAKQTNWNGTPALQDPSVRQRLAQYYIRLKGLEYTGYRTLTAISRGATPGPEASIGKLVGAPMYQEMASFACELQGAAGALLVTGGWPQAYLRSPAGRIAGGTDEIMRNIIAERVLRLPREDRVDKDIPFNQLKTGTVKK